MSEAFSFQDVWAIAACATEFPELALLHDDVPYAPLEAIAAFKRRVTIETELRCAELVALANTMGGCVLYGVKPGAPQRITGVREFRLNAFEKDVRSRLKKFGLVDSVIKLERIMGLAESPVLVIWVEKLKLPMAMRVRGTVVIPKVTHDGVRALLPTDPADTAPYAVSHVEAVRRRGVWRRRRQGLKVEAPPRFVTRSERQAAATAKRELEQREAARRLAEEQSRRAALRKEQQRRDSGGSQPRNRESQGSESSSGTESLPEQLTWEVLPEATLEVRWMSAFHESNPHATSYERREHFQRLSFLRSLGPDRFFEGRRLGERVYFVMLFGEFVVADSPQYGNAIYHYHGSDWRDVLSMPKLAARRLGAKRLVHSGDWQSRIKLLVARLR